MSGAPHRQLPVIDDVTPVSSAQLRLPAVVCVVVPATPKASADALLCGRWLRDGTGRESAVLFTSDSRGRGTVQAEPAESAAAVSLPLVAPIPLPLRGAEVVVAVGMELFRQIEPDLTVLISGGVSSPRWDRDVWRLRDTFTLQLSQPRRELSQRIGRRLSAMFQATVADGHAKVESVT